MKGSIFYPETNGHPPPTAEVEIHTPEGVIKGLLHKAEGARGAILMVGDAGGGLNGPAGLYDACRTIAEGRDHGVADRLP